MKYIILNLGIVKFIVALLSTAVLIMYWKPKFTYMNARRVIFEAFSHQIVSTMKHKASWKIWQSFTTGCQLDIYPISITAKFIAKEVMLERG